MIFLKWLLNDTPDIITVFDKGAVRIKGVTVEAFLGMRLFIHAGI